MNSRKWGDSAGPGGRRSRWTADRLLFLGVGVVLCLYALVSMLISR